ncbi:MAG: hypothetical protein ABIR51_10540, partial [Sphingomicrobium sp.]
MRQYWPIVFLISQPLAAAELQKNELLPVGIVTGGRAIGYSTGFLASKCHVLTVKHAAGKVAVVIGRRMKFRVIDGSHRILSSSGTVIAAGNADNLQWRATDRSGDWMVIALDVCLGVTVGYIKLSKLAIERSSNWHPGSNGFQLAGYPVGAGPWWSSYRLNRACHPAWISREQIVTNCDSPAGFSGGPMMSEDPVTGQRLVFAMHSAILPGEYTKGRPSSIEVSTAP